MHSRYVHGGRLSIQASTHLLPTNNDTLKFLTVLLFCSGQRTLLPLSGVLRDVRPHPAATGNAPAALVVVEEGTEPTVTAATVATVNVNETATVTVNASGNVTGRIGIATRKRTTVADAVVRPRGEGPQAPAGTKGTGHEHPLLLMMSRRKLMIEIGPRPLPMSTKLTNGPLASPFFRSVFLLPFSLS